MEKTVHPEEMEKIRISQAGNKGFTLLELIIVILIAGIAASIVYVFIGRSYENTVFKETTKRVFLVLRHARETALLEKANVTFRIDEKNNSYWTEKDSSPYGGVHYMPKGTTIRGEDIIFFPKGNSSGGRIKMTDKKERGFYIDVDPVLGTSKIRGL